MSALPASETCHEIPLAVPLALYLHIPYCRTRCTYCAFNTYTNLEPQIPAYVQALTTELRWVGGADPLATDTIYFGGGTPSLLAPTEIAQILSQCQQSFALAADTEITVEVNPGDIDRAYLQAVRAEGVNRLSIGMQSAHHSELRFFARRHTADDVSATVRSARQAGFTDLSLDLIYGVPGQTLAMWQQSLSAALALAPDHLSLYSLGIEDSTPMQRWLARGQITAPDPDLAADMYEWTTDTLQTEGYGQYEISNWARPGHICRHNLHYWRNEAYLGLGAGAHGYANYTRYINVLRPAAYIERMTAQAASQPFPLTAAADEIEPSDACQSMSDTMIMGLRLIQEGVNFAHFERRFGVSLNSVYGETIERLIGLGLLEQTAGQHLRLTRRARLISNLVFSEFV